MKTSIFEGTRKKYQQCQYRETISSWGLEMRVQVTVKEYEFLFQQK